MWSLVAEYSLLDCSVASAVACYEAVVVWIGQPAAVRPAEAGCPSGVGCPSYYLEVDCRRAGLLAAMSLACEIRAEAD